MRHAFSLIELTLCVALVGIFASLALVYLSEEPEKALVIRVKHELKMIQKELQARALKAPNYHFATLEEGLGRSEPLLDPWDHPYILMHGTFDYEYRPEIDYWVNGAADALYSSSMAGENGQQMLDHWVISAGPNKAFLQGESVGPEGAKLDDLKIKVRLGMPARHSKGGGERNPPQEIEVASTTVSIRLWDHASEDGDLVEVRVNGSMQVPKFKLLHAKKTYSLTLNSGMNLIEIVAHNEGTGSPNTVSCEVAPLLEGPETMRFGLKTGEAGMIHTTAP